MPKASKAKLKAKAEDSSVPPREPFALAGESIAAGTRTRFEIPIAQLQTDSEVGLPVCVLHGIRPGPTIWMSAEVHGDELNGVEVIRRILADTDSKTLSGTVIAVPIVNVFGFLNQSRYLPDRRDLL